MKTMKAMKKKAGRVMSKNGILHSLLLVVLGLDDWRVRLLFGVLIMIALHYGAKGRPRGNPEGQPQRVVRKRHVQVQCKDFPIPECVYVYNTSDKYHSNMECMHAMEAIQRIYLNNDKKPTGCKRLTPCGTCVHNFQVEKDWADECQVIEILNQ